MTLGMSLSLMFMTDIEERRKESNRVLMLQVLCWNLYCTLL